MNTIDGVGSNTSQTMFARIRRDADGVRARARDDMDQKAKTIVNAKGVSLYDARDDIMASVKEAMGKVAPGADRGAAFAQAMDQALADHGFDPAQIKQQMGAHHHGRHGQHQAAAGQDPAAGTADQMMQQLLARLPAGASVDTKA